MLSLLSSVFAAEPALLPDGHWGGAPGAAIWSVKGARVTIAYDGAAPESHRIRPLGPCAAEVGGTTVAVTVRGDRAWFARVVRVGDGVCTDDGAVYKWSESGCVDSAGAVTLACDVDGRGLAANGFVLHQRAEGVWSSEAIPSVRAADAAKARVATREAFVSAATREAWSSMEGTWTDLTSGDPRVTTITTGALRFAERELQTRLLTPCHVQWGADETVTWGRAADGQTVIDPNGQFVAVKIEDRVYACATDALAIYRGTDCEGYLNVYDQDRWIPDDRACTGTLENPQAFGRGGWQRGDGLWGEAGLATR